MTLLENGSFTMRMKNRLNFQTIDDYIASCPDRVQPALRQVRTIIRDAAPRAEETISYNIPTFRLNGKNFVHFAGWKQHVSLYPVPEGDEAFQRLVAPYRAGKGTLRFPLREPIPLDVVRSVVGHLIREM